MRDTDNNNTNNGHLYSQRSISGEPNALTTNKKKKERKRLGLTGGGGWTIIILSKVLIYTATPSITGVLGKHSKVFTTNPHSAYITNNSLRWQLVYVISM